MPPKQDPPKHPSGYPRTESSPYTGPVFPGKPHQAPYQRHNLAVQRSLMEVFDEFTDVIAGELKSMQLEDIRPDAEPPQSPE